MILDYCYHTHTKRCGHAVGEEKDYIEKALLNGFKHIGFSDHVMLLGQSQSGIRGDYSLLEDYINTVNRVKDEYKDVIDIHLGFECEYFPNKLDYYQWLLDEKVEYLIIGQHCYLDENGKFCWYFSKENVEEGIKHYTEDLIAGMSTRLFKYAAHPDTFVRCFNEYNPIIDKYARMICQASLDYDCPLELNLGGVRGYWLEQPTLHYPCDYFWKIAGEMGVKVVIGVDAHNPDDFFNSNYQYVFDLIEKYNLNYIQDYKL